ncbi:MAG: hypothetical protein ACRCXZ_01620 [Patescibacteria group bacterium]
MKYSSSFTEVLNLVSRILQPEAEFRIDRDGKLDNNDIVEERLFALIKKNKVDEVRSKFISFNLSMYQQNLSPKQMINQFLIRSNSKSKGLSIKYRFFEYLFGIPIMVLDLEEYQTVFPNEPTLGGHIFPIGIICTNTDIGTLTLTHEIAHALICYFKSTGTFARYPNNPRLQIESQLIVENLRNEAIVYLTVNPGKLSKLNDQQLLFALTNRDLEQITKLHLNQLVTSAKTIRNIDEGNKVTTRLQLARALLLNSTPNQAFISIAKNWKDKAI